MIMSVIKSGKNNNYTYMSNYHLRDKNLSYKAKGLLSFMLSLPEDWNYSVNGLVSCSKENLKTIQSILKELENGKYLIRKRSNLNSGKFSYEYIIYEEPYTQNRHTVKTQTVERSTEKEQQINTNKQNTKKINNILSCEVSNVEENNDKVKTETYKEIIDYMNTVYQHNKFIKKVPFSYRYNSKNTKGLINARLREGYTINDFKDVIWWGYRKFVEYEFKAQNEESSVKYFRPSTLFSEKHFEDYLNEYRANTE